MAHGCSRSACFTSIGWTNAHYHDGTREAETAGHRRRDWNGRWICLRYALEHPAVELVTTIGRRKIGVLHSKLNEVLHQDFADCSVLAGVLSRQDAAVFCLGTYTGSVSDVELRTITAGYTIEFARVLRTSSPTAAFSFLSGSGADPTGRSRMAFARYKGEAENALLASGFPCVYIFRPAYIYPVLPRKEPNLSYRMLRAIYPVFRVLFPSQVIRGRRLGPGNGECRRPRWARTAGRCF